MSNKQIDMPITKQAIQNQLKKAKDRIQKLPNWKKTMLQRTNSTEIEIGFIQKQI